MQSVCLADGAGSAARSEIGAQAVARAGSALLVAEFQALIASDDGVQVKIRILERLREELDAVAARRGCRVDELATTFLGIAASDDRFLIIHIGDGVIGYLKNGELLVASRPDNAEFANQTCFVTSSSALTSMRLLRGSLSDVEGFILMSDGTAHSLYDPITNKLATACAKLISLVGRAPSRQSKNPVFLKTVRKLLHGAIRDATKDDCSVAILARSAS